MTLSIAVALPVVATALITKVSAASAPHVVAPLCFFDPHFTTRALLELLSLYKLEKLLVVLGEVAGYLVLFAALPRVEIAPAVQAVVPGALGTKEFAIHLVKDKSIVTVRSRTPRNISLVIERIGESEF